MDFDAILNHPQFKIGAVVVAIVVLFLIFGASGGKEDDGPKLQGAAAGADGEKKKKPKGPAARKHFKLEHEDGTPLSESEKRAKLQELATALFAKADTSGEGAAAVITDDMSHAEKKHARRAAQHVPDGHLSKRELKLALSSDEDAMEMYGFHRMADMAKFFDKADEDHDGTISKEELVDWLLKHYGESVKFHSSGHGADHTHAKASHRSSPKKKHV